MRSFVGILALLLAVTVTRAEAQLASAELFVDINAGTNATNDVPVSDPQSYGVGPQSSNAFLGSGSFPWLLQSVVTGANAKSEGQLDWLATSTQVRLAGNFHNLIAATAPAAALGGFDAVAKITFTVTEQTPFSIAGSVTTGRELSGPEVVACQINGTVLAGDTRATPLAAGSYAIVYDGVIYPGESFALECAAKSDGGSADTNTVTFDATLTFGEGPATTTTTTLQPLTKRQCKKACKRGAAACRASCGTLEKVERRACRKSCKQRLRACGQSTGCNLPLG